MKPSVLVSNSLDQLLYRLKQNIITHPANPFYKIDIILSDEHSKTALEVELASSCSAIFGINVYSLEEFVKKTSGISLLDMFVHSDLDLQIATERARDAWQSSTLMLEPLPDELHLFAFSTLPTNVNNLLFSISDTVKVFYYVLSPCLYFWSDICTDKEAKKLTRKLQANCEYVYDRSKILANHGTAAREFLTYLEVNLEDFQEEYIVKESAAVRSEAVFKVLSGPSTRFDAILNDLLLRGSVPPDFTVSDNTVQLHKAPTLAREVEVLYQHIQEMPGRILIYAPDIEIYRPYIESLFSPHAEIVAKRKGTLLTQLLEILSLSYKKAQPKNVYELFQNPSFRKKCSIALEDLPVLATALQKFDDDFIDTIVRSWVSSSEITSTEAEVLGKCLATYERLQKDINKIKESKTRNLREWLKLVIGIFEAYFDPVAEDRDEFYLIKKALVLACKTDKENINQNQALAIFKVALSELETKKECTGSSQIIFASIGELRSIPRDTVCFLGMQEGTFLNAHDRHCILEAIFTTKSRLFISYQSFAFKERMFLEPASIVSDIMETVKITAQAHPLESCGKKEIDLPQHRTRALEDIAGPEHKILYVHELSQIAKYPLRAYLQRSLGLYLQDYQSKIRSNEFEVLNPRLLGGIKRKALTQECPELKEFAVLPELLRTAATALLDEDITKFRDNAKNIGIQLDAPLEIELSLTAKQLTQVSPTCWKVPALKVGTTTLAGTLLHLYPQGLVVFEKKSKDAIYKLWPELLLINILARDIPITRQVIFIKDAEIQEVIIENPMDRLHEYIEYILASHNSPSCLYPEWIELLKREQEPPEKCFESSDFAWRDPYLDFYLSRINKNDFSNEWKRWRENAITLFSKNCLD